jgi:hypothetical protein
MTICKCSKHFDKMKKYKIYLCSLIIVFLSACNSKTYEPEGLTKLSDTELIERAKQKIPNDMGTLVIKNEKGEILSIDSIQKIQNPEEWATDSYIDTDGIVKELILRKATSEDKELQEKVMAAFLYEPPIELVDIDCGKKAELLDEVYLLDQNMRSSGNYSDIDSEIDKQNLIKVVSLIENCGMPTTKEVSKEQINTIWLVLQHGDNANRKKYFPLLKNAAENGDLDKSDIALMEDRILITDGKPQIYGSQVTQNGETKKWELYELSNPETVNKRRALIGLQPLQDYLKRWDIEFNVEQVK